MNDIEKVIKRLLAILNKCDAENQPNKELLDGIERFLDKAGTFGEYNKMRARVEELENKVRDLNNWRATRKNR